MDGTLVLGIAPLSGGAASFTTSALSIGTHSIKAVYSGDSEFKTSSSAVITQIVQSSSSATMSAMSSALVDQVIGMISTDDVQSSGSLVDDLALEQVSAVNRRPRRLAGS
jgi:hypothetical protein